MNGTPQHIKELQPKIWLAKTPEERLTQFLQDNDAMFKAVIRAKKIFWLATQSTGRI